MPGAREKPVAGIGLSGDLSGVPGLVPRQRELLGVPRAAAIARWLQLSGLRLPGLVADGPGPVDVCSVWPEHLRDGRHHLPPLAHLVADVVRGDLVRDVAEERHLGIGATGRPGLRLAEADSLMCGKALSTLGWAVLAPGT